MNSIMNKQQLKNKLMDTLFDESRAEKIAEVIEIMDNNSFNEFYYELEENIEDEDYVLITRDANITSIVEYLEDVTIEDITTNFNGYGCINYLIASEEGEGFLYMES